MKLTLGNKIPTKTTDHNLFKEFSRDRKNVTDNDRED